MAGETVTTTTAVPGAATYTTGPTYTTAADVAGRHSYTGSADGLSLLAQRLQALTDDGVKSERPGGTGQGVQGGVGVQVWAARRLPRARTCSAASASRLIAAAACGLVICVQPGCRASLG